MSGLILQPTEVLCTHHGVQHTVPLDMLSKRDDVLIPVGEKNGVLLHTSTLHTPVKAWSQRPSGDGQNWTLYLASTHDARHPWTLALQKSSDGQMQSHMQAVEPPPHKCTPEWVIVQEWYGSCGKGWSIPLRDALGVCAALGGPPDAQHATVDMPVIQVHPGRVSDMYTGTVHVRCEEWDAEVPCVVHYECNYGTLVSLRGLGVSVVMHRGTHRVLWWVPSPLTLHTVHTGAWWDGTLQAFPSCTRHACPPDMPPRHVAALLCSPPPEVQEVSARPEEGGPAQQWPTSLHSVEYRLGFRCIIALATLGARVGGGCDEGGVRTVAWKVAATPCSPVQGGYAPLVHSVTVCGDRGRYGQECFTACGVARMCSTAVVIGGVTVQILPWACGVGQCFAYTGVVHSTCTVPGVVVCNANATDWVVCFSHGGVRRVVEVRGGVDGFCTARELCSTLALPQGDTVLFPFDHAGNPAVLCGTEDESYLGGCTLRAVPSAMARRYMRKVNAASTLQCASGGVGTAVP